MRWKEESEMAKNMLIAYGSWSGTTQMVAETLAKEFERADYFVNVVSADKVRTVSEYDAVILGAAIRMGNPHRAISGFLGRFRDSLKNIPVAYFIVCLTAKDDDTESQSKCMDFVNTLQGKAPEIHPVDIQVFAGALDPNNLKFPYNIAMKSIGEMNHVDMALIHRWADSLIEKMEKELV
jgi:menaquinone-dependent protoporphyrinogen oxidase